MNYKEDNTIISQYLSENAGNFDLLGNRKKVYTSEGMNEYKYDSVYQLTESKVNNVVSEAYEYDSVGNRLTSQLASEIPGMYNYDSNNRLSGITGPTGISYDYDDNGSRITRTENDSTTSYTYDYENRLKRIDFTDSSYAEYTYDALGRRIEKKIYSLESEVYSLKSNFRYCYDGEDIIAVLDSTNTAIASITHGPGIDHPLSYKNIATGQVYYYNQDYLGSITSITDSAQNIVASAKYDAFGNILTGDLVTWCSGDLVYAYTGREYDQESGLYFYRARYYDSKVGRFLETDPTEFMGGLNFYAYVGNNPVNSVDPKGESALVIGGVVVGVGVIVYKVYDLWKNKFIKKAKNIEPVNWDNPKDYRRWQSDFIDLGNSGIDAVQGTPGVFYNSPPTDPASVILQGAQDILDIMKDKDNENTNVCPKRN